MNPVRAALRSGRISIERMLLCKRDRKVQELVDLARNRNIPIQQESRDDLTTLLGHSHHQGVALLGAEYPYLSIEEILQSSLDDLDPLLILDSIQDPQNFGALLRSACFLGMKAVVVPKDRAARVTGTVARVSAGATAYIPVVRVTNLSSTLQQLRDKGLWIVGLDVEASQDLFEADLAVPTGLVVGNEHKGIRPLVRKSCDLLVGIPAMGSLQSLNAAAAGAIAMAEVRRQRMAAARP